MKKATEKSNAELAVFKTNDADMKAALSALTEAIKVLKSSKSPSLLELQSIGKTVQQAALLADALGLGGAKVQKAAAFFLQQGDVPVEMEELRATKFAPIVLGRVPAPPQTPPIYAWVLLTLQTPVH